MSIKFYKRTFLASFLLACVVLFAQGSTLHDQPAAPNYVLSLGGTNGFLELPSGAFNDLEEVTIAGWVKWMHDRRWQPFFDFGKEWRAVYVTLAYSAPSIGFFISGPGGGDNGTEFSWGKEGVARDLFRTNQWVHLVAAAARCQH